MPIGRQSELLLRYLEKSEVGSAWAGVTLLDRILLQGTSAGPLIFS
jgi:hypothetical protein